LKAVSSSNLRQLGIAINDREAQTDKALPPGSPRLTPSVYGQTNIPFQGPPQLMVSRFSYFSAGKGAIDGGVFFHILPYLEQDPLFAAGLVAKGGFSSGPPRTYYSAFHTHGNVKVYEGPADPTYSGGLVTYNSENLNPSLISYLANAELFDAHGPAVVATFPGTNQPIQFIFGSGPFSRFSEGIIPYLNFKIANIPDGTTNTIMFAEGYAGGANFGAGGKCVVNTLSQSWATAPGGGSSSLISEKIRDHTRYDWWNVTARFTVVFSSSFGQFAIEVHNVGPVFQLTKGMFQVRPAAGELSTQSAIWNNSGTSANHSQSTGFTQVFKSSTGCDPDLPQGNFAGGLLVCMADGSVHFVSQGVSLSTWSAAVLPADGQVPGNDW
jgi:hypothetical protein